MRYLALILAALTSAEMQAFGLAPRLVVSVSIDQLRTDYMEAFAPLYGSDGFRRLMDQGRVYDCASYPYTPVDRASAAATLSTGSTPFYNGIISEGWLNRETLQLSNCTLDDKNMPSPVRLLTSTLGDEMKLSSDGTAIVYSFAADRESAILSAGHAANGAYWLDNDGQWCTSSWYAGKQAKWIDAYNVISAPAETPKTGKRKKKGKANPTNDRVVNASLQAITANAMGRDDVSDLLCITLSATKPDGTPVTRWQTDMESVYRSLDQSLAKLINGIEKQVPLDRVLFVFTSTGYTDDQPDNLERYHIPTGTFYINRTASLLNVYLGAIYGQGRYVEACFNNEMYLDHRLIEQKRVAISEVLTHCSEFLIQCAGVADVYTSDRLMAGNSDIRKVRAGFNPSLSGDIIVDVAPGWKLLNEDNHQTYIPRAGFIPFPIVFMGNGMKAQHITTPVTVDHIAPTVAKAIRIRAPNACTVEPLF